MENSHITDFEVTKTLQKIWDYNNNKVVVADGVEINTLQLSICFIASAQNVLKFLPATNFQIEIDFTNDFRRIHKHHWYVLQNSKKLFDGH